MRAADLLRRGELVALPTGTVYGLGANAFDSQALGKIFAARQRPKSDPIIAHIPDLELLPRLAISIPDEAWQMQERCRSWARRTTSIL